MSDEKEDRMIDSTDIKESIFWTTFTHYSENAEMDRFLGRKNLPKHIQEEIECMDSLASTKWIKSILKNFPTRNSRPQRLSPMYSTKYFGNKEHCHLKILPENKILQSAFWSQHNPDTKTPQGNLKKGKPQANLFWTWWQSHQHYQILYWLSTYLHNWEKC